MNLLKKVIDSWKRKTVELKASVAFLFANVVSSGISYLSTPIYTRLLSSEEYGQVAVFMTWQSILGIVAMFCLSLGVFNNGMVEYRDDRDSYSSSMLFLSNTITIALSIILIVCFPIINEYINFPILYLILMLITFLFLPAYNFWVQRNRYEYKYKKTVLTAICVAIISPLFGIFGILFFEDNVWGRIFGSESSLILFYIFFYIHIIRKTTFKVKKEYVFFALRFNAPLIPHYLSMYILGNSDRIMISKLIGNSATAYYSVAYTVGSVILMVWSAVNASLIPFTYEKCRSREYSKIRTATMPIMAGFGVVSIAFMMVAPELIQIMATNDYMEAIFVVPPVVGGVFFQVQYSMYANVLYYYKKPYYVMFGSVISTILNIVLNFIFIPKFGYIAAAYTTLVCYAMQAIIDCIAMKFNVNANIYNLRKIALLSITMVAFICTVNLFYLSQPIRYLICATISIIVFVFRKKIVFQYKLLKQ